MITEELDQELEELKAKAEAMREEQGAAAAAAEEDEPAAVVPELTQQESLELEILELLKQQKDAPDAEEIETWKARTGNSVHILGLGEDDVYVFTHLTLGVLNKIRELVRTAGDAKLEADLDEFMKVKVVQQCVLFPRKISKRDLLGSRAGVLNTLYDVIMVNSYMLTTQQAMMLTTQL